MLALDPAERPTVTEVLDVYSDFFRSAGVPDDERATSLSFKPIRATVPWAGLRALSDRSRRALEIARLIQEKDVRILTRDARILVHALDAFQRADEAGVGAELSAEALFLACAHFFAKFFLTRTLVIFQDLVEDLRYEVVLAEELMTSAKDAEEEDAARIALDAARRSPLVAIADEIERLAAARGEFDGVEVSGPAFVKLEDDLYTLFRFRCYVPTVFEAVLAEGGEEWTDKEFSHTVSRFCLTHYEELVDEDAVSELTADAPEFQ